MRRRGLRRLAMVAVLGTVSMLNISDVCVAHAQVNQLWLSVLSCPSMSLCIAPQPNIGAVEVVNPLVGDRWAVDNVDWVGLPSAISCPSVRFCAVVDDMGDVATSTTPGNPTATWKLVHIDGTVDRKVALGLADGTDPIALEEIACPSASLCVAVDANGNILTSKDPSTGSDTWQRTNVDGTTELIELACASPSLCVALDVDGNLLASTDPTGGASSWVRAKIDPLMNNYGFDHGYGFDGLACPSASLCVAVDGYGHVLASSDPIDPSSWAVTGQIPKGVVKVTTSVRRDRLLGRTALGGGTSITIVPQDVLSCPSTSFCAIPALFTNEMFTSTDPGSSASTWVGTQLPPGQNNADAAVSCPTATFCVGTTSGGGGITSSDPAASSPAWNVSLAPAIVTPAMSTPPQTQITRVSLRGMAQDAPRISFTLTAARAMLPLAAVSLDMTGDGLSLFNTNKGVRVTSAGRPLSFRTIFSTTGGDEICWQPPASVVTISLAPPVTGVADYSLVSDAKNHRHATVPVALIPENQLYGASPSNIATVYLRLVVP